MPSTTPNYDEDIDDIMASIHQSQQSPAPPSRPAQPEPPKWQPVNTVKDSTFTKPIHSVFEAPAPTLAPKQEPRVQPSPVSNSSALHREQRSAITTPRPQSRPAKKTWKLKKPVKVTLLVLLFLAVMAVPGYLFRENISATVSDLLAPPSPFKQELVDSVDFPLFYPTKLPGSFKMETNNISSQDDLVLFVITDDEGKRINITLQDKPAGLNLEPLNELLTDKGELDTVFGKVMIGTSKENIEIVNIVTVETWIIVSSPKDTLSDQQFKEIIDNLKVVKKVVEE